MDHDDKQDDEAAKKDEDYRDDAPQLVDSSDYAQGNQVGQYAGGGPDTSSEPAPRPKGSQDWQQGITAANDPSDEAPTSNADDPDEDVHRRGSRDDGPSEQAPHRDPSKDDDTGPLDAA